MHRGTELVEMKHRNLSGESIWRSGKEGTLRQKQVPASGSLKTSPLKGKYTPPPLPPSSARFVLRRSLWTQWHPDNVPDCKSAEIHLLEFAQAIINQSKDQNPLLI